MDRVGFIGLGRMGLPMASNLCRKGFRLTAYDINSAAVRSLEAFGAKAACSVADVAAASDIVVTMLPDSAAVDDVVSGTNGILAHAAPGTTIMDMSTVAPTLTDRLASSARQKGLSFVDAPVGRLASHADRGESLFMVGASDTDFQRVKPLLEAMGTTVHHCGNVGTGIRTKIVNNFLVLVSCEMNAEALALSQQFGLSLRKTLDVLYGTTAVNGQLQIAWPSKVLRDDTEPGFTIDLAHKDLTLILESANTAKVPMPLGASAREAYSVARARGFGAKDFSAMVDSLCDLASIKRPRLAP